MTDPTAVPTPTVPNAAATPVDVPVSETKPLVPHGTFAKLELRVATVLEAREHPNAHKLLLLKVQVGDTTKQIVAGIKAHYAPETLVGTQIIVVNNLEPAMLRGEESQGMLLAATDPVTNSVVLLRPEKSITSGAKVK